MDRRMFLKTTAAAGLVTVTGLPAIAATKPVETKAKVKLVTWGICFQRDVKRHYEPGHRHAYYEEGTPRLTIHYQGEEFLHVPDTYKCLTPFLTVKQSDIFGRPVEPSSDPSQKLFTSELTNRGWNELVFAMCYQLSPSSDSHPYRLDSTAACLHALMTDTPANCRAMSFDRFRTLSSQIQDDKLTDAILDRNDNPPVYTVGGLDAESFKGKTPHIGGFHILMLV